MSIILQHSEADIPELVGTTCERFVCMQLKHQNDTVAPSVLWLKVSGGSWHRFLIDAWCLFWRERDEFEDESDDDCFLDDLGKRHWLEGKAIAGIAMRQTPEDTEFDSCLTISFADGRTMFLQHSEDPARSCVTVTDAV